MAIDCGRYRPGDVLPTLEEICRATGVSAIVARAAVTTLVREGLVKARPRLGTVVLERGESRWKGHVVLVTFGLVDGAFFSAMGGVIRSRLMSEGYLVSQVPVLEDGRGRLDFGALDAILRQPVSLAIVLYDRGGCGRHVVKAGVPVVTFGLDEKPVKGSVGHVRFNADAAVPDFVAHCRAAKVRRVVQVTANGKLAVAAGALRAAGIAAEEWWIDFRGKARADDCCRRLPPAALAAFEKRLSRGGFWLPDVLYFEDDYAATVALLALEHHRVRIPEDVRVVTWSNRGFGPYHYRGLARVEADPVKGGDLVAEAAAAFLSGREVPSGLSLDTVYVPDESFPAGGRP